MLSKFEAIVDCSREESISVITARSLSKFTVAQKNEQSSVDAQHKKKYLRMKTSVMPDGKMEDSWKALWVFAFFCTSTISFLDANEPDAHLILTKELRIICGSWSVSMESKWKSSP